ncbi:putative hypothetical protein [Streptomyces sp. NBRC 110611]|nr:albusnodin family lasso peptide [Streptomyces sp. NBRC 110611]GAU70652.1 putative hypothetical protein [Streptomyces sp. NBRC 110611]
MEHQSGETNRHEREEKRIRPTVIDLGDAATLTKGNNSTSVESKQTPYS